MADRVANLLAFGSLAPENPPRDGLAQMQIPSWYNSGTSFGTLAPPAPFPAANSVDWLQQRLPKAMGDWLGNAYAEGTARAGDLSPRTVAGEAITGAMNLMPAGRMAVPRQGIRAYHGSPHDFDRFDMSRIGTGEGAQAYGHGLYFAENPKTAQSYRDALSGPEFTINGRPAADNIEGTAARYLTSSRSASPKDRYLDAIDVLNMNDQQFAQVQRGMPPDVSKLVRSAIERLKDADIASKAGKMYEVNINAKPEQFLDWDRPIGQQSADVQQAVRPLIERTKSSFPRLEENADLTGPLRGQDFYRAYSAHRAHPDFASEGLRDAGIPGIRYLDQGSRGTEGKGTSNYVLFNDSIIDILKKWGLMGGMAGAGAAATSDQSQAQPFGSLAP